MERIFRFNSLQTGKRIQSVLLATFVIPERALQVFQFPSNGKAYPKSL